MNQSKLQRLLHQYLNNSINRQDCMDLLSYLNNEDPDKVAELIDIGSLDLDDGPDFSAKQSSDLLKKIKSDPRFDSLKIAQIMPDRVVSLFYRSKWIKIAAAALIFLTAGLHFFPHENKFIKTNASPVNDHTAANIVPGGKRATLTISKGKLILLGNAANGVLAQSVAGRVIKTKTGQIVYHDSGKTSTASGLLYNTLSTPKGGEYQVVLPDGTQVWLNAASSITYPIAFTGKDRRVSLTGEAYFEVAKNKEKPFYVIVNRTQIRVLGTHFNVAAYNDDSEMTTTLLQGSVQLTKNNTHAMLEPGQQAIISTKADKIAISHADIDNAVAWKNGYFVFDDDDITGIMKKISRWYDVSVSYRGQVSDQKFGGTFYRSKSITELLQYLEKIGKVKFTVEGRRIIAMP